MPTYFKRDSAQNRADADLFSWASSGSRERGCMACSSDQDDTADGGVAPPTEQPAVYEYGRLISARLGALWQGFEIASHLPMSDLDTLDFARPVSARPGPSRVVSARQWRATRDRELARLAAMRSR
jgi:hypothetical protein